MIFSPSGTRPRCEQHPLLEDRRQATTNRLIVRTHHGFDEGLHGTDEVRILNELPNYTVIPFLGEDSCGKGWGDVLLIRGSNVLPKQ